MLHDSYLHVLRSGRLCRLLKTLEIIWHLVRYLPLKRNYRDRSFRLDVHHVEQLRRVFKLQSIGTRALLNLVAGVGIERVSMGRKGGLVTCKLEHVSLSLLANVGVPKNALHKSFLSRIGSTHHLQEMLISTIALSPMLNMTYIFGVCFVHCFTHLAAVKLHPPFSVKIFEHSRLHEPERELPLRDFAVWVTYGKVKAKSQSEWTRHATPA